MSTAPPRPRPSAAALPTLSRIAAVAAVTAACAALVWRFTNPHNFFDLKIYVSAMRWWADGQPLYDYAQPDHVQGELYFTYPPFAAVLMRPLAHLPLGVTATLFTAGTLVALAVTTWWLLAPAAARLGQPRWFAVGLAVPLLLLLEPIRETVTFGQINLALIVLILWDLLFLIPRGSRFAGVGIGLATALKLFPGIFICYLLVTRRWRPAVVASATAAGATLLAAAVAPAASWQFWTGSLWSTSRVGRTDYTGNQSLQGLLSRLVAPESPDRVIWLALVAVTVAFGLWRAAKAFRTGDEIVGLTLTGLVGALVSPITWPHHLYWFVPAVVALVATGRAGYRVLAVLVFAAAAYGVVTMTDWGTAAVPTDTVGEFVLRNLFVLLSGALLILLPIRTIGTGEQVYTMSAEK